MDAVKLPLPRFLSKIEHTRDEVFYGCLRTFHKTEKHTVDEWKALLETYRNRPVKETH
jgi:hypothetical protein